MVVKNGSAVWVRWLVGTLWGVLVAVILFMGNTVRANDVRNSTEHTKIRAESRQHIDEFRHEVMEEFKEVRLEQKQLLVQSTEIKTILKSWEPSKQP